MDLLGRIDVNFNFCFQYLGKISKLNQSQIKQVCIFIAVLPSPPITLHTHTDRKMDDSLYHALLEHRLKVHVLTWD